MKRIKFAFQFVSKLIKRYWYTTLISLIVSVGVFFLVNNLSSVIANYVPETRYVGLVGKYRLNNLPPKISKLISYGLTEILPNSRATSSPIISNWTINAEGKEYTFFLKEDITWQDGEPLKSNQVEYEIEGAEFSHQPGKVIINLDSAFAPLPTLLTQPIFKNKKIGLGEYQIKKIQIQGGAISSLLLVNKNQKNQRLAVNFYPSQEDLITAFQLGKIDEAWGLSELENIDNWKNIDIKAEKNINTNYIALFLNTRKPPLDNKRVRQALAYCLKKPPEKDRAINPIFPTSWAYNEDVKKYKYDPEHGRNLFEEGWDPSEKISLKIVTLPELLEWAEKAKQNWQKNLNLEVKIQVSSYVPDYNNFDVFLGYGIIPPDPDQYTFWHSTQPENLTGVNNPKIDQLLEKGRKTIDLQERKEIYYDFQRALSEESPVIFLFYPKNYTIERK